MTVLPQQLRAGDRVTLTVLQYGKVYPGIVDRVSRDGKVLRIHTDTGLDFSVRADSSFVQPEQKSAP